MDGHSLVEVAHVLYSIRSTIVDGECWLVEPPREYCPFNVTREGRLGNLVQRFVDSVTAQASTWRALVSTFMMVFNFVGKGFGRWSS